MNCALFRRHNCREKNLQEGLKCDSLLTTWRFFDTYFVLISGLFFKCAQTFLPEASNIDWWGFSKQFNFFPSFLSIPTSFCGKKWRNSSSSADENNFVRFPFRLNYLTVFWCFTPLSALFIFWKVLMEFYYAPALCWPDWFRKCVSSLRKLEKNWNFWRCTQVLELVIKCWSDINEGERMHYTFYFTVLVYIVSSLFILSSCHLLVLFQFDFFI